jgi:RNA polymerase sigma-70 factor (ECF subfamily)
MEPSAIPDPTEEALRRHGAFVRALAMRMVRDPGLADDVTQETWSRWIERGPGREERGWLRTVVGNLARNALRARTRRERHETLAARPERARSSADEAEQAELLRRLVEGVLALEPAQRDTVLALYFRGVAAPALAEESGVPLATVRDRRRRALDTLRRKLDRELGGGAWGAAMWRLGGQPRTATTLAGAAVTLVVVKLALGLAAVWGVVLGARALLRDDGADAEPTEIVAFTEESGEPEPQPAGSRGLETAREPIASVPAAALEPPLAEPMGDAGAELARVSGRIVHSDGRPAADVALRLELGGTRQRNGEDREPRRPEDWQDVEGSSGADGRFELAFAPPADFAAELRASSPGCAGIEWSLSFLAPGETKDLGEATLFRAATIEGRVIDPHGVPLVGVEWRVSARSVGLGGTDGRSEVFSSCSSDPHTAAFRLEGLAPGPNALEASAALADRVRPPRVTLEEGALAQFDVVYDGADPARRILVSTSVKTFRTQSPAPEHVRLLAPDVAPRTAKVAEHSSASLLVFDALEPGDYTVVIDDERFESWSQSGLAPGSKVRAELTGSAALVLDVVDAATSEPVELYAVRVNTGPNVWPNEFVVWNGVTPLLRGRLTGLVPGDLGLTVTAGERTTEMEVEALAPGETRVVRVELQPPCSIAGRVRDPLGNQLAGIALFLVKPAQEDDSPGSPLLRAGHMGSPIESFRREVKATRSDAGGGFRFTLPSAGTYFVYADMDGAALQLGEPFTLGPGEDRDGLERVVALPGKLSGRVVAPGERPLERMRVLVAAAAESATWDPREVGLVADGRFELDLPAGPVRLYLIGPRTIQHHAGGSSGGASYAWSDDGILNGLELGLVEIPSGATLERDFAPPLSAWPGAIELYVRVDGAPAAVLHVDLQAGGELGYTGVGLETDAEGRIAGAPVFAGTWRVSVAHPDEGWRVELPEPLVVVAGQTTVATLEVERP